VSAIGQICRVRTWRQPTLEVGQGIEQFVKDHVNDRVAASMGNEEHGTTSLPPLRVTNVECVDDTFHPTFGATCRAYAYLIDVDILDDKINQEDCWKDDGEAVVDRFGDNIQTVRKEKISTKIVLQRLNTLLRRLEGKELDYIALSYMARLKVKQRCALSTMHELI
jgi:tRNA U38,U39,U40 pseudouridine synthase TruA